MCGHKLVAEQIWVLVQARSHLLTETLRIGRWLPQSKLVRLKSSFNLLA